VERSRARLGELLAAHGMTAGCLVRVQGRQLTLVREAPGPDGAPEDAAHVRLSHLGWGPFGVSVPGHTGTWERTPLAGSFDVVVEVLRSPMRPLVARWP